MAIAQFNISSNSVVSYPTTIHPVTLINPDSKKSITIPFKADTGATVTYMNTKYARQLGMQSEDVESGEPYKSIDAGGATVTYHIHEMMLRIGNLKPIPVDIYWGLDQNPAYGLLGTRAMYQFKVRFTKNTIRYEEFAPTTAAVTEKTALLSMIERKGFYRNRI